MSLWNRMFRGEAEEVAATPAPDGDFWYDEAPSSGARVSVQDALAITAFGCGVRYIAGTLSSCPCRVYERFPNGDRQMAFEHQLWHVVHNSPHEHFTALEFFERVVYDILTRGAHISRLHENAHRDIVSIEPLRLAQIRRDRQTGLRVFECYDEESGGKFSLVDSEVLFIPGSGCTPWKVTSLIDQYSETLQISQTARRYVRNYFTRGAIGPVYATFPQGLGLKQVLEWAKWLAQKFGGARNIGRNIPVIPNGGDLKALNIKHSEMQLNELQRFYIEEMARILGMPPHKLMDLMRSTNNNIEHQGIEAVGDCIRPMAERIEARLNLSLFGPRENARFYAEFDLDGLLRGDSEARAKLLAAEMQNGGITPNEYRRMCNRNRYNDPAGDKLYIQGATVPLELAGQQQAQPKPVAKEDAEAIDFDELRGVRQ